MRRKLTYLKTYSGNGKQKNRFKYPGQQLWKLWVKLIRMNPQTEHLTPRQLSVLFIKKQILTEVWMYGKETYVSFSNRKKEFREVKAQFYFTEKNNTI